MSDQLIDQLSRDLQPVRAGTVWRRLFLGLAIGAVISFVGIAAGLGLRPLAPAARSAMFWSKLAYTLAILALGLWSAERLARPGGDANRRLLWLLAPLASIAGLAAVQLAVSAPALRPGLVMGDSAAICPGLILLTSLPILLGLAWAIRGLAPTQLRAAGAIAGVTAGGAGASLYALHCPEAGAPFIALWYSSGVLLTGAVGAGLGDRMLRW